MVCESVIPLHSFACRTHHDTPWAGGRVHCGICGRVETWHGHGSQIQVSSQLCPLNLQRCQIIWNWSRMNNTSTSVLNFLAIFHSPFLFFHIHFLFSVFSRDWYTFCLALCSLLYVTSSSTHDWFPHPLTYESTSPLLCLNIHDRYSVRSAVTFHDLCVTDHVTWPAHELYHVYLYAHEYLWHKQG